MLNIWSMTQWFCVWKMNMVALYFFLWILWRGYICFSIVIFHQHRISNIQYSTVKVGGGGLITEVNTFTQKNSIYATENHKWESTWEFNWKFSKRFDNVFATSLSWYSTDTVDFSSISVDLQYQVKGRVINHWNKYLYKGKTLNIQWRSTNEKARGNWTFPIRFDHVFVRSCTKWPYGTWIHCYIIERQSLNDWPGGPILLVQQLTVEIYAVITCLKAIFFEIVWRLKLRVFPPRKDGRREPGCGHVTILVDVLPPWGERFGALLGRRTEKVLLTDVGITPPKRFGNVTARVHVFCVFWSTNLNAREIIFIFA